MNDLDNPELAEPEPLFRSRLVYSKFQRSAAPGMVYRVQLNDADTIVKVGDAEYVGLWNNAEHRAQWQAASDVVLAEQDVARQVKKDKQQDPLWEMTLDEIAAMCRRQRAPQRAQVLRRIVYYLSKGT